MFGRRSEQCCGFRIHERQTILVAEQDDRRIRQVRPAELVGSLDKIQGETFYLGLAGFPEHSSDGKAAQGGDQGLGNAFEAFVDIPYQTADPDMSELFGNRWEWGYG